MKDLTCPICGRTGMSFLTNHLKKTHGISKSEILERFPNIKLVSDDLNEKQRTTLKTEREKLWNTDESYRTKMKNAAYKNMMKLNNDPRSHQWRSDAGKSCMSKRTHEQKSEASKKAWTDERKLAQSERLRRWWSDPEYRKSQTARWHRQLSEFWSNPEIIPKMGYFTHKKYYFNKNGISIPMRSSWEVKFAEILSELNIDFEYENLIINYEYKGTSKRYVTDFYIQELNLIVEIKPKKMINNYTDAKLNACIEQGYNAVYCTEDNLFSDNLVDFLVESSTIIESR